jgi:glycerophosphoryl diester phosphodiesterase
MINNACLSSLEDLETETKGGCSNAIRSVQPVAQADGLSDGSFQREAAAVTKGSRIVRSWWSYALVPALLALLASCSSSGVAPTSAPVGNDTRPLIIAHRGARSLAPENTLAAARQALQAGADMWELDVAVTSDGELVVIHDDTLERTCNAEQIFPERRPWSVWEFTLAEVESLDCGSWFGDRDPFGQIKAGNVSAEEVASYVGERAPTLRQALEFTRDNSWRVNVELKEQPADDLGRILVDKTVALIQELGMDDGDQVVVSSFKHEYLTEIRASSPRIPIQALTSQKIKDLPAYLQQLGTNACNPKAGVWQPQELGELGSSGIEFNVWTVNDESEVKELIAAKVHGIITDYPQTLSLILNQ